MGIDRETLAQLTHLLRPLASKVRNIVARGVVQLVDDGRKQQMLQLGAEADEPVPDAEHFQPYGFSSVPLGGAEMVVIFPNGDRSHPLVVAVSDRRHRPTDGEPGQVTMYHYNGAQVTMLHAGNILITAAPGGQVLVDDDGSSAAPLPTMADFNALISILNGAGTGAATAIPAAIASYLASHPTWPNGTTVLKGK